MISVKKFLKHTIVLKNNKKVFEIFFDEIRKFFADFVFFEKNFGKETGNMTDSCGFCLRLGQNIVFHEKFKKIFKKSEKS